MTPDTDLLWLSSEQPPVAPPAPSATAAARTALLDHASRTGAAPHGTPRSGARRARRRPRTLAFAAVVAVALTVGVGLPRITGDGATVVVPAASAAPLVKLSQAVMTEPAPSGDATLVLRRHSFPATPGFTGADLYLDDGRYFYAPTRAGLASQITGGAVQPYAVGNLVATVAAAASDEVPIDRARAGVLRALLGPNPEPLGALEDNRIWAGAMDALVAGAGRKEVRAGALRLMASIAEVRVTDVTVDGRAALRVTNGDFFGKTYEERLIIDTATGVPLRMEGGVNGERPGVVVDYVISRVSSRDVAGR